ncbi:MAG: ABC transporter permease [Bacilli bacterium]|nr:ABC transporter permease [Bacilli bacterium]
MNNFINFSNLVILTLIPLMVVSIGAMISERGGVTNIALEGIMIFSAAIGIIVVNALEGSMSNTPQLLFLVGTLVAVITGIAFSALHAFASINLNADQIISATALNIFAPASVLFLTMTLNLGEKLGSDILPVNSSLFRIREVPFLSRIPIIGPIFFKNVYLSLYIGILVLVASYFVLYKTKLGLRIRSCGENPHASDAAGINVYKTRYIGVLTSGALAGMGGFFLISNIYNNYHASVAGFGFLAMAVMIFGNWRPFRIFFAAIFFSILRVLANAISYVPFLEDLELSIYVYNMLPFISTLVVLVLSSKSSAAPKSIGQPFYKGNR